jgi:hypothetical protein
MCKLLAIYMSQRAMWIGLSSSSIVAMQGSGAIQAVLVIEDF